MNIIFFTFYFIFLDYRIFIDYSLCWNFYEVIVNEGGASVDYRLMEIESE